jgi:hypothetical protein
VKLTTGSPHNHIQGAKKATDAFSSVFRTQLMASFSIDASDEDLDNTFTKALDDYLDEAADHFQLPPQLMLDFVENNMLGVLVSMEAARVRIADRCVELLGVTDPTISDADLASLLDEGGEDQD